MKIIPAIDIINGKCVRLSKGDYTTQKVYSTTPVDVARLFEDHGISHLHVVDLDGARANHIINYKVLEDISKATSLKIDFGGGLKSAKDVEIAFNSGAAQVTGGSVALKNPQLFLSWLEKYGPDKIILGADSHHRKIMTQGWIEGSDTDVLDFIRHYEKQGLQYVIPTDIAKDGMLEGPAIDLYEEIINSTHIKLIASGGVSSMEDINNLASIGCYGVIVGKAIYEGKINLKELAELC